MQAKKSWMIHLNVLKYREFYIIDIDQFGYRSLAQHETVRVKIIREHQPENRPVLGRSLHE